MFAPNRMALLWFVDSMFYIFHEKKYIMNKTTKQNKCYFFKKEVNFQVRQTLQYRLTIALYPPLTALIPPSASASMMAL